jgi:uncharacterized protein (DUF111 family)
VLRVLIGEPHEAAEEWMSASLHQVDTTVDDLDPRVWPDLLSRLRAFGAADAWCTPALTHQGRPGQILSALVPADRLDLVCLVIFEETPTLGVRISALARRSLRRDQVEVPVGDTTVRVKRGYLGSRMVTVQPEYADALAAAQRLDVPVTRLIEETRAVGRRLGH